jgi:hypothetical protein
MSQLGATRSCALRLPETPTSVRKIAPMIIARRSPRWRGRAMHIDIANDQYSLAEHASADVIMSQCSPFDMSANAGVAAASTNANASALTRRLYLARRLDFYTERMWRSVTASRSL